MVGQQNPEPVPLYLYPWNFQGDPNIVKVGPIFYLFFDMKRIRWRPVLPPHRGIFNIQEREWSKALEIGHRQFNEAVLQREMSELEWGWILWVLVKGPALVTCYLFARYLNGRDLWTPSDQFGNISAWWFSLSPPTEISWMPDSSWKGSGVLK